MDTKALKQTTSCGGVIWRLRNGRHELLLVKQFAHRDFWGIPKGHLDPGETLEECAKREVREEAGVDIVLGQKLPSVHTVYSKEDKTVLSWLSQCSGSEEPRSNDPDSEVADVRWFDVDALPNIHYYQRPLIEHALKILRAQHNEHI